MILYAGGDGTTRDIVNALGEQKIPLIGAPGKDALRLFCNNSKCCCRVLFSFIIGDLMSSITEVMDLDEEVYLTEARLECMEKHLLKVHALCKAQSIKLNARQRGNNRGLANHTMN